MLFSETGSLKLFYVKSEGSASPNCLVHTLQSHIDQIASYRDAFALFDVDNSGTISPEELARVMGLFGQNPSEAEVSSIMEKLDKDQSGMIEFEEFVHMMASTDVEAELREAFRVFDQDGSGNINFEELQCVMRNLGRWRI
jgi:calmodulin